MSQPPLLTETSNTYQTGIGLVRERAGHWQEYPPLFPQLLWYAVLVKLSEQPGPSSFPCGWRALMLPGKRTHQFGEMGQKI